MDFNIPNINMEAVLNYELWGNAGRNYLAAGWIFLATIIILWIFKMYIIHVLRKISKKTKTELDDMAVDFIDNVHWQFYMFLGLFLSTRVLKIPEVASKVLTYVLIILVVYYVVKAIQETVDFVTNRTIKKREKEEGESDTHMVLMLGRMIKTIIWIIAFLTLLSNFGINVTSLIAGLGIGGIAIAFALQNVLEDLFASFSIFFDKPFKVGDFIIIGSDMGVVKQIGLKTTRIQTLQGQELVVSNKELTSTRVNNYKRMEKRRIVFAFGVEYSTSLAKLKKINKIVTDIITKIKLATLDRVHFKTFGDFSLNFEVVYYLDSKDYNVYMDTQQEINYQLKEHFAKEKISMAFPTQTVILEK